MESDAHPRMRRRSDLQLGVKQQAFAYQLQAVEAVKDLPYAALFHEQGLGKTKIGIDLALEWLRSDAIDAVLIVTKRSLVQNWSDEILLHSHLKARVLDQNHASNYFALNSAVPLYLTHYEVLRSEQARMLLFLKTRRVGVILDEAHKIKNPETSLSSVMFRLGPLFVRRVIMTGTPVANRPYDLWAQIYFLDHGVSLGTDFKSFKESLDLSNDLWKNENHRDRLEHELADTFRKIRAFSVRETKGSAGIDLPQKRVENIKVDLAPRQRALYDQIRRDLSVSVVADGKVIVDDADDALKRLLRLVQVASNPRLVDESYTEEPGKIKALDDLVRRALEDGSKVIVWTAFIDNAEWLSKHLSIYGAVTVHGSLPMDERNASLAVFKRSDRCRILVATPGAAKEGLTLTVANHAIFYDRSFSLDDYLQAQDRIHRISQTRECFIWNLIGANSVDEWVDSLLTAKRLAAQLAQADITLENYASSANYDFGRIVKEILGGSD